MWIFLYNRTHYSWSCSLYLIQSRSRAVWVRLSCDPNVMFCIFTVSHLSFGCGRVREKIWSDHCRVNDGTRKCRGQPLKGSRWMGRQSPPIPHPSSLFVGRGWGLQPPWGKTHRPAAGYLIENSLGGFSIELRTDGWIVCAETMMTIYTVYTANHSDRFVPKTPVSISYNSSWSHAPRGPGKHNLVSESSS